MRAHIYIYIYTAPESVNRSVYANEKRRVMKYPWSLSPEIRISGKQGRVGPGSKVDQRKYESPKFDEINMNMYIYIYMVSGKCKWFRVQITILSRWINFENGGDETRFPISGDEN